MAAVSGTWHYSPSCSDYAFTRKKYKKWKLQKLWVAPIALAFVDDTSKLGWSYTCGVSGYYADTCQNKNTKHGASNIIFMYYSVVWERVHSLAKCRPVVSPDLIYWITHAHKNPCSCDVRTSSPVHNNRTFTCTSLKIHALLIIYLKFLHLFCTTSTKNVFSGKT